MECGTIQSLQSLISHKGQIRGGLVRQVDSLLGIVKKVIGLATTTWAKWVSHRSGYQSYRNFHQLTNVDRPERVTSRDFSGNEKVVLAYTTRTLSQVR